MGTPMTLYAALKAHVIYERSGGEPVAVVLAPTDDEVEAQLYPAINDYTGEHYLEAWYTVPVLSPGEVVEFAKEYMAKLGEKYYDEHYQSAAQLQGESTLGR